MLLAVVLGTPLLVVVVLDAPLLVVDVLDAPLLVVVLLIALLALVRVVVLVGRPEEREGTPLTASTQYEFPGASTSHFSGMDGFLPKRRHQRAFQIFYQGYTCTYTYQYPELGQG